MPRRLAIDPAVRYDGPGRLTAASGHAGVPDVVFGVLSEIRACARGFGDRSSRGRSLANLALPRLAGAYGEKTTLSARWRRPWLRSSGRQVQPPARLARLEPAHFPGKSLVANQADAAQNCPIWTARILIDSGSRMMHNGGSARDYQALFASLLLAA